MSERKQEGLLTSVRPAGLIMLPVSGKSVKRSNSRTNYLISESKPLQFTSF